MTVAAEHGNLSGVGRSGGVFEGGNDSGGNGETDGEGWW